MTSDNTTPQRRLKRRYWLLLAVGVGLVVIPASLWLFRIPIAEIAVRQVCNDRGINCSVQIDQLNFSSVSLYELELTKDDVEPVTAERLALTMDWNGWFSPVLTSVSIFEPHLTVDTRGGEIKVAMLEALQSGESSGSSGMELPPFAIENGRLTVLTDAGPVTGTVSSSGALQREITSNITLEPAQLVMDGHQLDLRSAHADLIIAEGRISGQVEIDLRTAELETVSFADVMLEANITPANDHEYEANWQMRAEHLSGPGQSARGIQSDGLVRLTFTGGEVSTENLLLDAVDATLSMSSFNAGSLNGGQVAAQLRLDAEGERLVGEIAGTSQLELVNVMRAERSVLTGNLSLDRTALFNGAGSLEGVVSVTDAALEPVFRQTLFSSFTLPQPFTAHAQKVQGSLLNLASGFSTGLEFEAGFTFMPFTYELNALRPGNIQGDARSEILRIGTTGTDPWLHIHEGEFRVQGDLQFSAPRSGISLSANRLSLMLDRATNAVQLSTRRLHLDEIEAEGREIMIDFARTDFQSTESQRSLSADGHIHFTGDAFGFEFEDAEVRARVQGFDAGNGWNFRFERDNCLGLDFETAALPTVAFGPASLELCAPNDLLFVQQGSAFSGGFLTEAMDIPFYTGFAAGSISLQNPQIIWRYEDVLDLELAGDNLIIPMRLAIEEDGRAAHFHSEFASTALATNERGLNVSFDLTDNDASLEDLPVDIEVAEIQGSGHAGSGGLNIDYSILGALFTDGMNEPINAYYQPLVLNGTGELSAEGISLDGRLRLSDQTAFIGDVSAIHWFSSNRGSAVLENGALTFEAGGLQLHHLSERLRGLAVNAEGALLPAAQFSWQDGVIESTGQVDVDGLSFDTFRLGRLNGLSGTLNFTDLIGFRTAEAQRLTLDEFRFTPTLVLTDGVAEVSLLGPDGFSLEHAEWPFVGGRILIEPTIWNFDEPSQMVIIEADEWDLHSLLGLFSLNDLDIAGRASGRFPIEIVGANAYLRDAFLRSIEDGTLSYRGDVGESASTANEYAGMAFDALRNFEYEVLGVSANGNLVGNIVLGLQMQGHNPDVLDGQLFKLNISIDSELAELVHAGSMSASVQSTQDMITDLIREERESQQND